MKVAVYIKKHYSTVDIFVDTLNILIQLPRKDLVNLNKRTIRFTNIHTRIFVYTGYLSIPVSMNVKIPEDLYRYIPRNIQIDQIQKLVISGQCSMSQKTVDYILGFYSGPGKHIL